MAKLDEATNRLKTSVDRLESLLTDSNDIMAAKVTKLSSDIQTVSEERDSVKLNLNEILLESEKLRSALKNVQEKYASTQVVNEAVASRLDIAITDLKRISGES